MEREKRTVLGHIQATSLVISKIIQHVKSWLYNCDIQKVEELGQPKRTQKN